jgi:hypothetical protein
MSKPVTHYPPGAELPPGICPSCRSATLINGRLICQGCGLLQAARRETYRRYNASAKGQERHARYEEKHPERATRWGPLMELRKHGKGA